MILSAEDCQCPLVDEGVSLVNTQFCMGTATFMVLLQAFLKGRCNIASPCERIQSVDEPRSEYDFIVVGGGSAGAIVAARLSENNSHSVLLIEAGEQEPIGARPPSFYRTFWSHEKIDWNYRTVPADYCLDQNGLGCLWPRGKVLGGSSVLNGMMYHRGHPADYEDWVKAGATGWSWEENLPYFEKTEGNKQIGTLVSEKYHSASGPLPVQQFNYQPLAAHVLLQAIDEVGLPVIADMNDPRTPDGFTIAQTFTANGQRYTTARAFLRPNSERPNLDVKLQSLVSRVLFEGKRAVGVEYYDQNGIKKTVRALKEVILSAGALNTPQILMLSGIGPREVLEPLDIPVLADLPVGKSLKNHYGITFYFHLKKLEDTEVLDWTALTKYLLKRDGPMSGTGVTQLTGILYSSLADRERKQPDLQFFFNGFYAECTKTGLINETRGLTSQDIGRNVSANAALLLPRSEGFLTINSTDPFQPPLFVPGYFAHPDDLVMIQDGARYLERIFKSDTLKQYGLELDKESTKRCDHHSEWSDAWIECLARVNTDPQNHQLATDAIGRVVDPQLRVYQLEESTKRCDHHPEWSDAWIECLARVNTDPQNHQLATAAIGRVVDPQLRVYQLEGLRVADASAMPTQPTGNPQGAIMMVAERAAAFIQEAWS